MKKWLRGLRAQFVLIALLPLVSFGILISLSLYEIKNLSSYLHSAHKDIIPNLVSLGESRSARQGFKSYSWQAILHSEDKQAAEKNANLAMEQLERLKKSLDAYDSTSFTPEEQKSYDDFKPHKQEYYAILQEALGLIKTGVPENMRKGQELIEVKGAQFGQMLEKHLEFANEIYIKQSQ